MWCDTLVLQYKRGLCLIWHWYWTYKLWIIRYNYPIFLVPHSNDANVPIEFPVMTAGIIRSLIIWRFWDGMIPTNWNNWINLKNFIRPKQIRPETNIATKLLKQKYYLYSYSSAVVCETWYLHQMKIVNHFPVRKCVKATIKLIVKKKEKSLSRSHVFTAKVTLRL